MSERTSAIALSAVAGFVDTAGFLALFGLFTAHVTGNFVTAGAALALQAPEGVAARLAMIPVFMVSVAATTLGARSLRSHGATPLAPLLGVMTAALALFWAAGVLLRPWATAPDSWAVVVIGGAGVVALGVQNALMRESLLTLAPTTVMTGNLTQLTMDVVAVLLPPAEADPAKRATARAAATERVVKLGTALGSFVAGAAAGAGLTARWGLWSLGLPTMVLAGLTLAGRRRTRS